jgi:antibiotic biosynthesis monooxygenase (ABM) superfamily enzyme
MPLGCLPRVEATRHQGVMPVRSLRRCSEHAQINFHISSDKSPKHKTCDMLPLWVLSRNHLIIVGRINGGKTMDTDASSGGSIEQGATVVITHRVREGKHADYEKWLNEIAPICRAAPGHLDWHIILPISGLTETYTVLIRFDTRAHLQGWMESPARARLIEKVQPLFVTGDDFFISSGLDFWFTPGGAKAKVPVRWKQYLVTWSAIYPLALGVPLAIGPVLRLLGVPNNHLLTTLVVTGIVVFLMVYVVMPRYTKVIQRWLFT